MRNYDVIIIGGGPAGISAAIWCADLGLTALLIEKSEDVGGQLLTIYNPITNYPGVTADNGAELCELMRAQLDRPGITVRTGEVVAVDLDKRSAAFRDGDNAMGRFMVIATGVRRRKLAVPGEETFAGKGILRSGSESRNEVSGKRVIVVGGGDAAVENALILSEKAGHVTLIHRGPSLSAREGFVSELNGRPNVSVKLSTRVEKIFGSDCLQGVHVTTNRRRETIECDNLVIRIGVEPNSDLFKDQIALDGKGYIRIDAEGCTSRPYIYAVGDVAFPVSPTISTAAGSAATAVKSAHAKLSQDDSKM